MVSGKKFNTINSLESELVYIYFVIFFVLFLPYNMFTIFQGFDWSGLLDRSLKPPIIPTVQSPSDTTNFDQFVRDLSVPKDETSGWDAEF